MAPPPGCAFHPRCPFATEECRTTRPELREVGGRAVACHHAERIAQGAATAHTPDAERLAAGR